MSDSDIANEMYAESTKMANFRDTTLVNYMFSSQDPSLASQAFQCFNDAVQGLVIAANILHLQKKDGEDTAVADLAKITADNKNTCQEVFMECVQNLQIQWGTFNGNPSPSLADAQSLQTNLTNLKTFLTTIGTGATTTAYTGISSYYLGVLTKGINGTLSGLTNTIIPNLTSGKAPYAGNTGLQATMEAYWVTPQGGTVSINSILWPSQFTPTPITYPNK